jgi:Cu/Ag efflux protein CusF
MMMRVLWVAAMVGGLAASGCSSMRAEKSGAASPTPAVAGTLQETAITATARVKKIDLKTRKVTLEAPDGQPVTVTAGPEVRNLDQVKVGDDVVVTYFESVAFEVRKAGTGTPGVSVAEGMERAEPGQRPRAAGARVTTITATITGIDKSKGTVTLTGPEGDAVTVKVRNPANLDKVANGDLVDITLTEAVAISVEPARK